MLPDPLYLDLNLPGDDATVLASSDMDVKGRVKFHRSDILGRKTVYQALPKVTDDTSVSEEAQNGFAATQTLLTVSHSATGKGVNLVTRHLLRADALCPAAGVSSLTGAKPISAYLVLSTPDGLGHEAVDAILPQLVKALQYFIGNEGLAVAFLRGQI